MTLDLASNVPGYSFPKGRPAGAGTDWLGLRQEATTSQNSSQELGDGRQHF